MKRYLFFFLSLPLLVSAAAEKNGAAGLGLGYRRDHFSFAEPDYKESTETSDVLLEALLTVEKWNWLLDVRGDFGWFVAGRTNNEPTIGGVPFRFTQSAGGFFADGEGRVGLVVPLVRGADFSCIPSGGVAASYQQIKRGINRPEAAVAGGVAASYDLSHTRLKQLWWGPFVGADLRYRPIASWVFEASYFYRFLYYDQHFQPFSQMMNPAGQFLFYGDTQASTTAGVGQTIRGKIGAQVSDESWLNIRYEKTVYKAGQKSAKSVQTIEEVSPAQNTATETRTGELDAWWNASLFMVEVEYIF